MRIATWNVNSLKVRLPRVEEWLAEVQPDVLCMCGVRIYAVADSRLCQALPTCCTTPLLLLLTQQ